MAIIQIDNFIYTRQDSAQINVKVFFNTSTNYISHTTDPDADDVLVQQQRGYQDGTVFTTQLSDDGNLKDIAARYYPPYAQIVESRPSPPPNPPQCDLTLSVFVTNEQSQDAKDGSATPSTSGSFDNQVVSIDNVNFFPTPHTFSGLQPGNYVAYGKDSNGCTQEKSFTVEPFNNPIEGGFEGGLTQVEVSPGNISRWNAGYNPIVIKFQKDPDPAKKNFRYEIEITSNENVIVGTWSPNAKGFCRADISAYLQGLVNAKDDFKYDVLNYRDLNRAASFTIRYREVWDAGKSSWFEAPQPLYVTYSAKQLQSKYGGNMAEYVPFLNSLTDAKFLTGFKDPEAWVGLPYDTSFIFSEYLVNENVKLRTISLDVNKNPIAGGVINSYLLNNDAGYVLATDTSRLIIKQGALPPVSNDSIIDQLGINRLMLAGPPANGVYYFAIQLYTGSDDDPNYVTEQLIIKINKPCKDPYIYVKWLNDLGGWDYWRFGKDQIYSLNTSNGLEVDRNVFDWENDDTIADVIQKTAVDRVSIGATVTRDTADGFKQMASSIKVMVLVNTNPYQWQTVLVNVGQFDVKSSKLGFANVKFTLTFAERNIQRQ